MIEKTEAIVLALRPFSRTSLMVTWLSRDFGRIVTPVKGANRPKSLFLGQIDIGYRSELLFYTRGSDGVHNIRETTPLDYREGLRGNWRASVAAGYVCALTAQSVETLLDSQGLFDDLEGTLSALAAGDDPLDVIVRYEFALASRLGIRPDFGYCADCPCADHRDCRFAIPDGHLSCAARPASGAAQGTVALTREVLDALRRTQGGAPASAAGERAALAVRRFMGIFLSHHLDLPLHSRRAAFAWLESGGNAFGAWKSASGKKLFS